MTWGLTSPITGAAQTGLTSPTYTHVADQAPDVNAKQVAITALGGTQTGVQAHSVSSPFTITAWRQKLLKVVGKTNPVTGLLPSVPMNVYTFITRKGVLPLAGQPASVMDISTKCRIPAGADAADPLSVKAALSAHIGALSQQSAGVGDTVTSGIL